METRGKRLRVDSIMDRCVCVASDLGLTLDLPLCSAEERNNGMRVVVSVAEFPVNEEERDVAQAALHAELLNEFAPQRVEIHVMMPPVLDCISDLEDTARTTYEAAIRALPWRDTKTMHDLVPFLVQSCICCYRAGIGVPVLGGNVDAVLPSLASYTLDGDVVYREACRYLDRHSVTLREVYEYVHASGPHAGPATRHLRKAVFRE